ncbi:MAG: galactose-1-phosphate uridylyltransferase [Fimbriimonadaceae bacterium]
MSELRYHPFLDTWVITATHRQDRTFLPPDDYCPLCPTAPGGFPTEVPFPEYDIVVFENKFPSLSPTPPEPAIRSTGLTPVRPSEGVCEVVLYSQDHNGTFAGLPFSQVRKLTRVWRERYIELSSRPAVEYVFVFENKGKEIGVTLVHPHGQIYAYPFIPPTLRTELASERRHLESTGKNLFEEWLAQELAGPRIVAQNDSFVAVVPFFARYPYEVHVVARGSLRSLAPMSPAELDDLAEILLVVARKYDLLFGFSLPYIMVMHQEPAVPGYEFTRFHVEFYPPYRTANKLKYLAGSEAGAGAFINDTLAEDTSATLRRLDVGAVR